MLLGRQTICPADLALPILVSLSDAHVFISCVPGRARHDSLLHNWIHVEEDPSPEGSFDRPGLG